MSDDDEAVMKRLAALEAEVKADAEAQRARKEAALAKVRAQAAARELENKKAEPAASSRALAKRPASASDDDDDDDGFGGTLALAKKAHGVRKELARQPKAGEKSWVTSGVASLLLGPVGWLYAGSLREAIPATAAWLAFGALASKIIPMFLLMPVLLVLMPLSGIAGVVYAVQFNRKGGRQRLFDKKKGKGDGKDKKLLPGG